MLPAGSAFMPDFVDYSDRGSPILPEAPKQLVKITCVTSVQDGNMYMIV